MLSILNAVLADGSKANLWLILYQVAFLIVAALVLTLILLPKRKKAIQPATKPKQADKKVDQKSKKPQPKQEKATAVATQAAVVVETPPTTEQTVVNPVTVVVERPVAIDSPIVETKHEPSPVEVEPKTIVVEKIVEVEKPVIVEKVVEKAVVLGEESVEAGILRYDRSFEARLIQSTDEVKHWYTEIKNELLAYKGCKARMSWKRETFKANKQVVAMLVYRGNTLCLFVPLQYADYADNKDIETTDLPTYADTPIFIRLKNDKRVRIAKELITTVMQQAQVVRKLGYISEDFYVPYEGILELINKGLVRREIRTSADESIFDSHNN